MQKVHKGTLRRLKTRTCDGFVVIAMILCVFSGCVIRGKVKPDSVTQESAETKGSSVARLEDGRKGFIITEISRMDEASRRDFDEAITLLEDREWGQAIDLLNKVIEQAPGVTAPYIDIAIAYQQIGKPEQAEKHLKTALQLVPEHPVAGNEYGLLYRKTGRFAEARAIYEKVVEHFPDYYPVHKNLGILCDLYLNDPACAIEHYEIYSKAKPEDKQVKLWIADLRARLGPN